MGTSADRAWLNIKESPPPSTPPPSSRETSIDTGEVASPLIPRAEGFTPSGAGAAGALVQVQRSLEAKKNRVVGVMPLFSEGECYAVIQLVPDQGAGGSGVSFEDFLLTSVVEQKEERSQVFETFRLPIIYFMDASPSIYAFSGFLFAGRTPDGKVWVDQFLSFYETKLRGTKCVENQVRAAVSYENTIVSGYVLSTRLSREAEQPMHSPFSFNLYVTSVKYLG